MEKYKYLILGAGPSGLAFAHSLLLWGESSFLILEKETDAGGLCRSVIIDGYPLDIGGGHFLDVKNKKVLDFLFHFMSEKEWSRFDRKSSINFGQYSIDYPLEANLWQFPIEQQVEHLLSVSQCGENSGQQMPEGFEKWIIWKLGEKIAEDYMFPYNRKIWSVPLNTLGTYWMEKLPAVSFREVLTGCLTKRAMGSIPAHGSFYYPAKTGYGEVWDRMAVQLGSKLRTATPVHRIDIATRTVNDRFQGETIVNTIPWNAMELEGLPEQIASSVAGLRHTGIDIDYFAENLPFPDQWIYVPNEEITYHRILNRMGFIPGSRGYWTETNSVRSRSDMHRIWRNTYAYPLNTINKPDQIKAILEYSSSCRVFGLGRWGQWEHINSDVAVARAIELAESLIKKDQA